MKLIKLDKILNILIIIYPFGLMVEPKIINGINILLLILFLMKIRENGLKTCFIEKYTILFIVGILISFIDSPYEIKNGLVDIKRMLRWIFFPLILGQFKIEKQTKKYLLYSIIVGITAYAFRFYFEIFKKINFGRNYGMRYSGGYIISQVSLILGITLIVVLILLIYTKMKKSILLVVLLVSLGLLILTQTRGMYVSILLTTSLILFIKNKKHFLIELLVIIFIASVVLVVIPNNKYVRRMESLTKLDTSNLGRIEVMKEAYRIGEENLINGVGYRNFKRAQNNEVYKYNKSYQHPHNILLKLFSETGIIGMNMYLLLILNLIKRGYKGAKDDIECLILLSIVICLFCYEMTDIIIQRNFAYPYIFFIIGILLNKDYKKINYHIKRRKKSRENNINNNI